MSYKDGYARLEDFGEITQDVTLKAPDGRELRVRIRTLGEQEMRRLRKMVNWPKEPMEPGRDPVDGKIKQMVVEHGPLRDKYNEELDEAAQVFNYLIMAHSLVQPAIEGDTLEQKAQKLRETIGFWATKQILDVLLRANSITEEEVARAAQAFPQAT